MALGAADGECDEFDRRIARGAGLEHGYEYAHGALLNKCRVRELRLQHTGIDVDAARSIAFGASASSASHSALWSPPRKACLDSLRTELFNQCLSLLG